MEILRNCRLIETRLEFLQFANVVAGMQFELSGPRLDELHSVPEERHSDIFES